MHHAYTPIHPFAIITCSSLLKEALHVNLALLYQVELLAHAVHFLGITLEDDVSLHFII